MKFKTKQELFWIGKFGNQYIKGATLFSVRSTPCAQTVSSLNLKMVIPINGHTHKRALTDHQGSPRVYLDSRGTSK